VRVVQQKSKGNLATEWLSWAFSGGSTS